MLLRLIALLEWFSTLAIQMIALRQAIPVVGSSVVLTSIYIWIILLALSGGYRVGWVVAEKFKHSRKHLAMILWCYLIIAGVWYSLVTFGMHTQLLEQLLASTWAYILTLFLVSMILFVVPVFLASQTLPLLTELVPIKSKGHAAWQMLFASTIGSFLWSVLTATVLFPTIGVNMTWAITVSMVLLAWVLSLMLWKKRIWIRWLVVRGCMSLWLFVSTYGSSELWVIWEWDTPYHSIQIKDYIYAWTSTRLMTTNWWFSSARDSHSQTSPFSYLRSLVEQTKELQPETVLLIGTAWFTYPAELDEESWLERIDAIDIDGAFLDVAQDYLLWEELTEKVVFYPDSARFFVQQAIEREQQYNLILLDAYNGRFVPAELATVEFFEDLKKLCSEDCQILSNLIVDRELASDFAQWVVGSMQLAFGDLRVQSLHKWNRNIGNSIIATYRGWDDFTPIAQIKKSLPSDDSNDLERELVEMWNAK